MKLWVKSIGILTSILGIGATATACGGDMPTKYGMPPLPPFMPMCEDFNGELLEACLHDEDVSALLEECCKHADDREACIEDYMKSGTCSYEETVKYGPIPEYGPPDE